MKKTFIYFLFAFCLPVFASAQVPNLPKDARVDVTVADMKGNMLSNEIIVFRSSANGTEFQGLSDSTGKFFLRLPSGAKYDVFVLGFHDSASNSTLEIPALKPGQYYKDGSFKDDIQFQPAKSFVLDNCNFETGKALLEDDAYKALNDLVDYLNRKDDERIEVGGHTDNVGSAVNNLKLSTDRANTVRAYLLTKGISPDRVTAKGYGATVPVADNKTADGRAQNRRTEVTVL